MPSWTAWASPCALGVVLSAQTCCRPRKPPTGRAEIAAPPIFQPHPITRRPCHSPIFTCLPTRSIRSTPAALPSAFGMPPFLVPWTVCNPAKPCALATIMTRQPIDVRAVLTEELLRKFNTQGPRYTSYPTADRFSEKFGLRPGRSTSGTPGPIVRDGRGPDWRLPNVKADCIATFKAAARNPTAISSRWAFRRLVGSVRPTTRTRRSCVVAFVERRQDLFQSQPGPVFPADQRDRAIAAAAPAHTLRSAGFVREELRHHEGRAHAAKRVAGLVSFWAKTNCRWPGKPHRPASGVLLGWADPPVPSSPGSHPRRRKPTGCPDRTPTHR
jgi:hypothetical protein